MDFLRYGASDKPDSYQYSVAESADTVENLVAHLNLAYPVSGGHVLELAVKALPRAVVTELPDVGHYPSSEAPQTVAAAVRDIR